MKLQLAKSPCSPSYGVLVGDNELWDGDCASDSIETTLALIAEVYPGQPVIMFDNALHYSQQ